MSKHMIIGVPVLPGFAPIPSQISVDTDDRPYNRGDFSASTPDADSSSARSGSVSSQGVPMTPTVGMTPAHGHHQWKLCHTDFMPKLVKEKTMSDNEYENFPILWRRGNAWLQENPQALLFSCETVTWMTVDRTLYTDQGVMTKSMHDKKTRMIRGIRIWYFTADDTFFDSKALPAPCKFGYLNYVPEGKNDSLGNMLNRLNEDLIKKPVAGIILRVESLTCNQEVVDADTCCWAEQAGKDRSYYTFLRVYFTDFPQDNHEYGQIAIRDFVPQQNNRTPHNAGYETFGEVWKKAARWIYTHPAIQPINTQGVFVKLKKDASEGEMVDRVYHTEHGSSHSTLTNTKTEYLQIIRLIYCNPKVDPVPQYGLKMAYKVFYPSRVKRHGEVTEDDPAEQLYEDLTQMEDKLNSWINFAGARMIGVETLPVRLKTGGQETLGSEATYVVNSKEKNYVKELWRNNIRIYMEGHFRDTPITWSRSMIDTGNGPPPKE